MSVISELSEKALQDDYLKEIFYKSEQINTHKLFGIEQDKLSEKEFVDLLRFSDLLSRSKNSDAQNRAYKIISLLEENHHNEQIFQTFANSVMVKLGNFPALSLLEKTNTNTSQPYETLFIRAVKETYQEIPNSEYIFTDPQYKIFESLKGSNHYSFSGPTSLGKSFIINAFIRYLIKEHRGTDNIVILVPSRALINQTVVKLKEEFKQQTSYTILAHPTVPPMFKKEGQRYIFIFTPERLISYLSDPNNPKLDYLFVDEAHKTVALKDTRSPLYYHAISQAEQKSVKLYFASPNIQNPEAFLQLFEKSTDESIAIKASPVAQNRYFLDLVNKKGLMFSDVVSDDYEIPIEFSNHDKYFWLDKLGRDCQNIVYCNSKTNTVNYALQFSNNRKDKECPELKEVINLVEEHLHKKYYLIDCLKKGIAFHFGNLPQLIREKVEWLFENGFIDYLFSTSTLLEGVNLPVKNMFILSNRIGLSKFIDIDFWNLAGRAGRMTKEMSGNIICMKVDDKGWETTGKQDVLNIIRDKKIKDIQPLIIKGQNNFYKNINNSLQDNEFTRSTASQDEKDIWDYYANITLIHEMQQTNSILRNSFFEKNNPKILEKLTKETEVPSKILSSALTIKAKYQNTIFNKDDLEENILTNEFVYKIILDKLRLLCDYYKWDIEESGGINPMMSKKNLNVLKYYAFLMNSWISSQPLKMIIEYSIKYYKKKGLIFDKNIWESIQFYNNPKHINIVVNEVIADIEHILRFKLKIYFDNYYNILVERLGEENAGVNWADYLEYGTSNKEIIELQNIGIPRHLSQYILKHHKNCLNFDEQGNLSKINYKLLKNEFNKTKHEYKECEELSLF
jgi:hypothetical protein